MIDLTTIIVNSHWSDLILALDWYYADSHQFAIPLTYQQFWETCPKGEWLLHWIAKEGSTPHKLIVHAACQCARLALPYYKEQQRPLKAIETTEKWCRGEATLEEVKQARDAASADAPNAATHATTHAAASATYADAAAFAAATASNSAGYAAGKKQKDARKSMQLQTADLVRSLIPMSTKLVDEYEHILKLKAFI